MIYTLEYAGSSYELPKFTKSVSDKIGKINAQNENTRIPDMDKYKSMYEFICEMIGNENAAEIFETDQLDEIDLNDITVCYLGICAGYEKPVNDFKKKSSAIDEKDKQFVLDLFKNAGNLKELEKIINSRGNKTVSGRFSA